MNQTSESVGRQLADKMIAAIKTARKDPVDAEHVCRLITDALEIALDYEVGKVRETMQAEIDVRQKEIERLNRKLTAPAELF